MANSVPLIEDLTMSTPTASRHSQRAAAVADSSRRDLSRRLGREACRRACKEAHMRTAVTGALAEQVAIHLMTESAAYSPRPRGRRKR